MAEEKSLLRISLRLFATSRSEMEISMIKCLCVGLGGAAGAMLRYLIGLVPVGASNGFPVKTLLINILGAFVIGVLAVLGEKHSLPPLLVLTLKTGVSTRSGGFTTFSTFALETSQLFQNGSYGLGIGYVCASVILSIAAVQLACLWLS